MTRTSIDDNLSGRIVRHSTSDAFVELQPQKETGSKRTNVSKSVNLSTIEFRIDTPNEDE